MRMRKPSILRWDDTTHGPNYVIGYIGDVKFATVYRQDTGSPMSAKWRWKMEVPLPITGAWKGYGKGISEHYCRKAAAGAVQKWLDAAGLVIQAEPL